MLGFDTRAARWTWTAVIVLLSVWIVYLLRSTLFLFILAVLFAYLLAPLVNVSSFSARQAHAHRRAGHLVRAGGGALRAGRLPARLESMQQATLLAKTFPDTLHGVGAYVKQITGFGPRRRTLYPCEFDHRFAARLWVAIPGPAGELFYVVIIPILPFLLSQRQGHDQKPRDRPAGARPAAKTARQHPGRHGSGAGPLHMRALVLLSATTFTCYSIFLTLTGVNYGILLGVMAGMLEFIPVVGPLGAAVVVLAVGGMSSGGHLLAVLIFLVVFRLFQDYVVSPHLMGHGVELHSLLVLFGVFAGAELAGVPGTFLSWCRCWRWCGCCIEGCTRQGRKRKRRG